MKTTKKVVISFESSVTVEMDQDEWEDIVSMENREEDALGVIASSFEGSEVDTPFASGRAWLVFTDKPALIS